MVLIIPLTQVQAGPIAAFNLPISKRLVNVHVLLDLYVCIIRV